MLAANVIPVEGRKSLTYYWRIDGSLCVRYSSRLKVSVFVQPESLVLIWGFPPIKTHDFTCADDGEA
jgi:hypothetical protein